MRRVVRIIQLFWVFLVVVSGSVSMADGLGKLKIIKDVGFDKPETVLHDVSRDIYLVSNIGGHPAARDDNGYISQLNPDGTVKNLRWIDGKAGSFELHSPKGMTIYDGKLYVADIDTVRIFNAATGAFIKQIAIEGATFLNDVAINKDGEIFVSESALIFKDKKFQGTGKDAIYRIGKDDKVTKWKSGITLGQPNGMEFTDEQKLAVVTRGGDSFYILNQQGDVERTVKLPGQMLDGIINPAKDVFVITSWGASSIYRLSGGRVTDQMKLPIPAANLGYDAKRKKLLLPLLLKDQVAFLEAE